MPGNVQTAVPSSVFPQTLCTAFMEDRSYVQLQSALHDGTILRSQLASTSRKSFRLSRRLSAAEVATLKSLWDSNGPYIPMLFYNPFEATPGTAIGSNYDPTGSSTVGRYTVVFRNQSWNQNSGLARVEVLDIQLVEVQ